MSNTNEKFQRKKEMAIFLCKFWYMSKILKAQHMKSKNG